MPTGAGRTFTCTCDVLAPEFTESWKTYVPAIKPVTPVETVDALVMVGVFGPDTFVQE